MFKGEKISERFILRDFVSDLALNGLWLLSIITRKFMWDKKDNEPTAYKKYHENSNKDGISVTPLTSAVMLGTKPPISWVIHLPQVSYNCCWSFENKKYWFPSAIR